MRIWVSGTSWARRCGPESTDLVLFHRRRLGAAGARPREPDARGRSREPLRRRPFRLSGPPPLATLTSGASLWHTGCS